MSDYDLTWNKQDEERTKATIKTHRHSYVSIKMRKRISPTRTYDYACAQKVTISNFTCIDPMRWAHMYVLMQTLLHIQEVAQGKVISRFVWLCLMAYQPFLGYLMPNHIL